MQKFKLNQDKNKEYLPYNLLAEKIVLNNLLINSEAIEITLKILDTEAFYLKSHQEIYKAITYLYQNQTSVDLITLTSFLQDNGLLEKIGGISLLVELMNQVPNFSNLEDYIGLIQDKFLRRKLIKIGYQTINSAYVTNIPLENILTELEIKLFYLIKKVKTDLNIKNTSELFTNIFFEIKQKSLKSTLPGIESGFYELDALTQGFQKSDLIIVAGRPSMGKTAFCLNTVTKIVKKNRQPVLFCTLEMSKEQLLYRLLSTETKINSRRLRTGSLNKSDWKSLAQTIKIWASLPLFLDDTPNLSVMDVRSKIKQIILEQENIGLVVIDYLQLMQNSKYKMENRVQELSQITRTLKIIAREFNVPIIVLSQLSRSVENRINKRPILSDLRESGSIEQDADLVLMLYRDNYYNNQPTESNLAELIIAKHRNGPTGKIRLNFDPRWTKFSNYIFE